MLMAASVCRGLKLAGWLLLRHPQGLPSWLSYALEVSSSGTAVRFAGASGLT
jgi:hypothetical protein